MIILTDLETHTAHRGIAQQRLSRLAYLAGERDRPFASIRHPLGALPGRLHPVPEDYFG